jgi:glycosyltransferase involved in cell wall biosynthesis
MAPLSILHVLRAPVGGLFRHVVDLARGQAARGHRVGVTADSTTGGERADAAFAELAPQLALGLERLPMSRHIGLGDVAALRRVAARIAREGIDVVHGHGAKGGAYARLTHQGVSRPSSTGYGRRALRVYTPHGGSLNYDARSPQGLFYLAIERLLAPRTDLSLFESAFAGEAFRRKIGPPGGLVRIVHNGVAAAEFAPIVPAPDAADLVFVGELRRLKGVDVLIEAMAALAAGGRPVSAAIVGAGPDAEAFAALARARGLTRLRFTGALPARAAFALGRLLVVPSRAESLPYVVLEAAAAGIPLLATAVGGIPEIFGPQQSHLLLPPGDARALAAAIAAALADPAAAPAAAATLRSRVRALFSAEAMTDQVLAAYSEALAARGAQAR